MAIDSSGFSKNKAQHFDWYDSFTGYKVQGFPKNNEIRVFLKGLTHVLVCENPLNFYLLSQAKRMGVKVFIQSNYEFCDHLNRSLELPTKFLMPSYWMVQEMKDKFGDDVVQYLPPPIRPAEFKNAREVNFERADKPRLLHIIGTLAANDRNGTLDLLDATRHTWSDYELVIRSQHELPKEYMVSDRRIRYVIENELDVENMYKDFDALILPRRYGGLSLTTCEALMSGMPVIMPDISPNNELLPKEWLVDARKKGEFYTRTNIDIYQVSPVDLAEKIDWFIQQDQNLLKTQAFDIGYNEFSDSVLKPKYEKLLNN